MTNFLEILEKDLEQGGAKFYSLVQEGIEANIADGTNLPSLENHGITQIDIGRGTLVPVRLHFQARNDSAHLSAWGINEKGTPTTPSLEYDTLISGSKRVTFITGSHLGSMDGGDMTVTPQQVALAFEDILARSTIGNIVVLGS